MPTGKVKESLTDTTGKTIELNRYTFESDGRPVPQGNAVIDNNYEELEAKKEYNGLISPSIIAVNLSNFLTSSKPISEGGNGGYYIGRYETGEENGAYVCKLGKDPTGGYNLGSMYGDGYGTGTFTSDLVNSYAWDTAIVFIQTFGGDEASAYSQVNNATNYAATGENRDEYCKINDMSGNVYEKTTETCWSSWDNYYNGMRGGGQHLMLSAQSGVAGERGHFVSGIYRVGSRPILYLSV